MSHHRRIKQLEKRYPPKGEPDLIILDWRSADEDSKVIKEVTYNNKTYPKDDCLLERLKADHPSTECFVVW